MNVDRDQLKRAAALRAIDEIENGMAVEPVPSPTTMPSWTNSTAASAAARFSASRLASAATVLVLMIQPRLQWRLRGSP